jgi:hypothetical protein
MELNVRKFAVSILAGGLIALGSSVAMAQTVNNIDNTTSGESGHGSGCSNFIGGCASNQESSASGTYQPTTEPAAGSSTGMTTGSNLNSDNTTPGESGHGTGCSNAADSMPGHCLTGPINN